MGEKKFKKNSRIKKGYIRKTNEEFYSIYKNQKINNVVKSRRPQRSAVKRIASRELEYKKKRGILRRRWRKIVSTDSREGGFMDWKSKVRDNLETKKKRGRPRKESRKTVWTYLRK